MRLPPADSPQGGSSSGLNGRNPHELGNDEEEPGDEGALLAEDPLDDDDKAQCVFSR